MATNAITHLMDRMDAARDERDHWRSIAQALAAHIAGRGESGEVVTALRDMADRFGAVHYSAAARLVEESEARYAEMRRSAPAPALTTRRAA